MYHYEYTATICAIIPLLYFYCNNENVFLFSIYTASTNTMSAQQAQERFIAEQLEAKKRELFALETAVEAEKAAGASSTSNQDSTKTKEKMQLIEELRKDLYQIPEALQFHEVQQHRAEVSAHLPGNLRLGRH